MADRENMATWDSMARPPAKFLKTIGAGRLKGKSDINPQWRALVMTERFGPCGVGWKYTIEKQWSERGAFDEVFVFVNVHLFVRHPPINGDWSDPIPGSGGHKLVLKETNGLHNNDEAYKMATTDALGNAMKYLGVAAEIFLGNWDGSKYSTPDATKAQPPAKAAAPPASQPTQADIDNHPLMKRYRVLRSETIEMVESKCRKQPEIVFQGLVSEDWFRETWKQIATSTLADVAHPEKKVYVSPVQMTVQQFDSCEKALNDAVVDMIEAARKEGA